MKNPLNKTPENIVPKSNTVVTLKGLGKNKRIKLKSVTKFDDIMKNN